MTSLLDQFIIKDEDPNEVLLLDEEIAQGSFGTVYRGRIAATNQVVAVKIIQLETGETFDDLAIELEVMSRAKHENIISYWGSWEKGDELFIAMELCDGGSTTDIYSILDHPLKEVEIRAIVYETLKGLDYMHNLGYIHRDIKGGNILLKTTGEVKLIDFGVSGRISAANPRRTTFIGTPYWMAPEIIENKSSPTPYDSRADIWSVGITILELAECEPPLANIPPMKALFQIPYRKSPTLRNPSDWSSEMANFLSLCLEKETSKRPTVEKLLDHPWMQNIPQISTIVSDLVARYLSERKRLEDKEMSQTTEEEADEDELYAQQMLQQLEKDTQKKFSASIDPIQNPGSPPQNSEISIKPAYTLTPPVIAELALANRDTSKDSNNSTSPSPDNLQNMADGTSDIQLQYPFSTNNSNQEANNYSQNPIQTQQFPFTQNQPFNSQTNSFNQTQTQQTPLNPTLHVPVNPNAAHFTSLPTQINTVEQQNTKNVTGLLPPPVSSAFPIDSTNTLHQDDNKGTLSKTQRPGPKGRPAIRYGTTARRTAQIKQMINQKLTKQYLRDSKELQKRQEEALGLLNQKLQAEKSRNLKMFYDKSNKDNQKRNKEEEALKKQIDLERSMEQKKLKAEVENIKGNEERIFKAWQKDVATVHHAQQREIAIALDEIAKKMKEKANEKKPNVDKALAKQSRQDNKLQAEQQRERAIADANLSLEINQAIESTQIIINTKKQILSDVLKLYEAQSKKDISATLKLQEKHLKNLAEEQENATFIKNREKEIIKHEWLQLNEHWKVTLEQRLELELFQHQRQQNFEMKELFKEKKGRLDKRFQDFKNSKKKMKKSDYKDEEKQIKESIRNEQMRFEREERERRDEENNQVTQHHKHMRERLNQRQKEEFDAKQRDAIEKMEQFVQKLQKKKEYEILQSKKDLFNLIVHQFDERFQLVESFILEIEHKRIELFEHEKATTIQKFTEFADLIKSQYESQIQNIRDKYSFLAKKGTRGINPKNQITEENKQTRLFTEELCRIETLYISQMGMIVTTFENDSLLIKELSNLLQETVSKEKNEIVSTFLSDLDEIVKKHTFFKSFNDIK